DDDHAVVGKDHRGVAVHLVTRRRDRGIHPVAHLLQLEEILLRGGRIRGERAARCEVLDRFDRSQRYSGLRQELATSERGGHGASSAAQPTPTAPMTGRPYLARVVWDRPAFLPGL